MADPRNPSWGAQVSISINSGGQVKISGTVSVNHRMGNFAMASGLGVSYYTGFMDTKASGIEARVSGKLGFDDGTTSAYLGTNQWLGLGKMKEFNQRTGIFQFKAKDFSIAYENDGAPPFAHKGINIFADAGDSYRTAAAVIRYKDFTLNLNLFTGKRDQKKEAKNYKDWHDLIKDTKKKIKNKELKNDDIEKVIQSKKKLMEGRSIMDIKTPSIEEVYKGGIRTLTSIEGANEADYTNLLTIEDYTTEGNHTSQYRFSTLTLGYRSLNAGIESEKIRHLFQNRIIHNYLGLQPQVEMLNNRVTPYVSLAPFRFSNHAPYYRLDPCNSFTLW